MEEKYDDYDWDSVMQDKSVEELKETLATAKRREAERRKMSERLTKLKEMLGQNPDMRDLLRSLSGNMSLRDAIEDDNFDPQWILREGFDGWGPGMAPAAQRALSKLGETPGIESLEQLKALARSKGKELEE